MKKPMTTPDPTQIGCGGWTPQNQPAKEKAYERLAHTAGSASDCPPDGYRMLTDGEKTQKGDLFLRSGSESWKPTKSIGGHKWNPQAYWPMARKIVQQNVNIQP